MKDEDTIRITLRVSKELNEKLETEAKLLGISKNAYIVMRLQDKIKK